MYAIRSYYARYTDRPDQQQLQQVVGIPGKTFRAEEIPPHQGDENPGEEKQAERVGKELEAEVEIAVQDRDTEVILHRDSYNFV